jgi:C4-dicarboxylate-binding protein DctP
MTLEGAMRDATVYVNQVAKKENDDALEAVRKAGKAQVYMLTPQQRFAWKKALLPVHREQGPRIGMDTINAIYKATGFDPDRL